MDSRFKTEDSLSLCQVSASESWSIGRNLIKSTPLRPEGRKRRQWPALECQLAENFAFVSERALFCDFNLKFQRTQGSRSPSMASNWEGQSKVQLGLYLACLHKLAAGQGKGPRSHSRSRSQSQSQSPSRARLGVTKSEEFPCKNDAYQT